MCIPPISYGTKATPMLSLYSQPTPLSPVTSPESRIQLSELSNVQDAVVSFTNLTVRSGITSIRLHCKIPTWSPSTDTCLDLHDLNELRSRFLLFIHDLLKSLRSSGVSASYSLAPSNTSLCLVCPKPVDIRVLPKLDQFNTRLKREQVALVNLDDSPCLIIT